MIRRQLLQCTVFVCVMCITDRSSSQTTKPDTPTHSAVLWTDPGDIRSRDLYWGLGGREHQPQLPVEFLQEDAKGTSPKFDVRDAAGKKWKAKLGVESKPETAAARLLWAIGYEANENYFFPDLQVTNMPGQLELAA